MAPRNDFNPVEYLVSRRFPAERALAHPPSLSSLRAYPGPSPEERRRILDEAAEYRKLLWEKSSEELSHLVQAERTKEFAAAAAKVEAEEQARFFNQAWANADFAHWCKASHWTIDEAVALSFGKAPELVSWEKIKPYLGLSPFAFQYQRKRDLCLRAVPWNQLFDPVLPGIFMAWAKRNEIEYPVELERRVAGHGHRIADWKSNYDEMKRMYDELMEMCDRIRERRQADLNELAETRAERDTLLRRVQEIEAALNSRPPEKELGGKERQTALKLIIGMAVRGYRFDPTSPRSPIPKEIASDLSLIGVPLDEDTVRKWLRNAAELIPSAFSDETSGRR